MVRLAIILFGIPAVILFSGLSWFSMVGRYVVDRVKRRPHGVYNTALVGDAWSFDTPRLRPYWRKLFKRDRSFLTKVEFDEHHGKLPHRLKRIAAVWSDQAEQLAPKALSAIILVLLAIIALLLIW